MTANANQVSGEIHFPKDTPPFTNATVSIILQDVSIMDAPAPIISQQRIENVNYQTGKTIEFAFTGIQVVEKARYNLFVHVSMSGDENIQQSDYLTVQDYPVLTHDTPQHVIVTVQHIG